MKNLANMNYEELAEMDTFEKRTKVVRAEGRVDMKRTRTSHIAESKRLAKRNAQAPVEIEELERRILGPKKGYRKGRR